MIYAVASHKGGVGKTTAAVNFGAALRQRDRSVLVVDMDPQANASLALGVVLNDGEPYIGDLLCSRRPLEEVVRAGSGDVAVLPARKALLDDEEVLGRGYSRQEYLARVLSDIDGVDDIVIDCPPALGLLTANAIFAAEHLLVPLPLDTFAFSGLEDLIGMAGNVRRTPLPTSLVISQFDARAKKLNEALQGEIDEHAEMICTTRIPRCEAIRQAQGAQVPVVNFDGRATASLAFAALVDELSAAEGKMNVAAA